MHKGLGLLVICLFSRQTHVNEICSVKEFHRTGPSRVWDPCAPHLHLTLGDTPTAPQLTGGAFGWPAAALQLLHAPGREH